MSELRPMPCPLCGGLWRGGTTGYYHIDNHGECALASVFIDATEVAPWNRGAARIRELEAEVERLRGTRETLKRNLASQSKIIRRLKRDTYDLLDLVAELSEDDALRAAQEIDEDDWPED